MLAVSHIFLLDKLQVGGRNKTPGVGLFNVQLGSHSAEVLPGIEVKFLMVVRYCVNLLLDFAHVEKLQNFNVSKVGF
jgi:hypothetical protein